MAANNPKTLLEIIQEFTGRTGLTVPTSVVASQDDGVLQYRGLCNECIDDLTTRHVWGMNQQEALVTTVAQEDQGALDTLAPLGFEFIIRNRIYNRTRNLIVNGPVNSDDWQLMKAANIQGPLSNWRVRGGRLLLYPKPSAGETLAFEYASRLAILDVDGTTRKYYFEKDTDVFLLPSRLLISWLSWRWKKVKGFDYDEDFRLYETFITQAAGNDNEGKTLDLSSDGNMGPGIFVPAGTWIKG